MKGMNVKQKKRHPAIGFPVIFPYVLVFKRISCSFFYAPICVEIISGSRGVPSCQSSSVGVARSMHSNLTRWICVCATYKNLDVYSIHALFLQKYMPTIEKHIMHMSWLFSKSYRPVDQNTYPSDLYRSNNCRRLRTFRCSSAKRLGPCRTCGFFKFEGWNWQGKNLDTQENTADIH